MKIGYLMEKGEEIRRPPYNGPANHVRHVVQELCKRGHTVRLLARLERRLWVSDDLTEFRPVFVPSIDRGWLRFIERSVRSTQAALHLPFLGWFEDLRFARACRQELVDCDVFLERMSWIMGGGVRAARQLGIPLALEYNGDPLADLVAKGTAPAGLQLRISTTKMRSIIQSAAHVIATGDGWRQECIEKWGAAPENVTTVENGTDLVQRLRRTDLRSFQEDPPDQAPMLVFLGGFYAWHGVPVLLEAFSAALRQFPAARLLLIGAGRGEADARQQVQELDISENVSFLGQMAMEAVAPLLASADIAVSPYCGRPEFDGLKIYDYKAAGLPVIASGDGRAPRAVRAGTTGLVVPPCDPQALQQAICTLLSDASLRRKMGRQGRQEAEDRHGWEHTAANLETVLAQMHQGRPITAGVQS